MVNRMTGESIRIEVGCSAKCVFEFAQLSNKLQQLPPGQARGPYIMNVRPDSTMLSMVCYWLLVMVVSMTKAHYPRHQFKDDTVTYSLATEKTHVELSTPFTRGILVLYAHSLLFVFFHQFAVAPRIAMAIPSPQGTQEVNVLYVMLMRMPITSSYIPYVLFSQLTASPSHWSPMNGTDGGKVHQNIRHMSSF